MTAGPCLMKTVQNIGKNEKEVNVVMMNMHNSRTKKIISCVVIILLVLAMVAPMVLGVLS